MKKEYNVKTYYTIVLYGDNMVGTTSLLRRYLYDTFDSNWYSRLTDYYTHKIELDDGNELKFRFVDIYHYRGYYNKMYFKRADGIMLTYDKTNYDSFMNVKYNLDDVKEYVNGKIPMALIGCKEDLFFDEQIKSEEGENFAKENDLIFFETSAKEDLNVIECFNEMISRVVENNQDKIYNGMKIKKVRLPKKGCLK